MPTIASLYRYPVKGLSPEMLDRVALARGAYVPFDRLYAIENGPCGFDAAAPSHMSKAKFLMLMKNASLAELVTRYDEETGVLAVARDGAVVAEGDLRTREGRATVEAFFEGFSRRDLRGPPRILAAPEGFRFTDSRSGFVSLVNLASVADIGRAAGAALDPLRMRANLYLDGLEPWVERGWQGRTLAIGDVRLKVTAMTDRCAATHVDPATGARDVAVVPTLMRAFGHVECGVYARVAAPGEVTPGQELTVSE